ncbi:hypothetical protein [uncultured Catenibacterium sp.]|uniref:hypothetical protein n=1 Tax=uncultured Catenibacterium sp. TaxID=286142 RepID=UPI002606B143|nr:hypothetical protein [uncultured Catenibacterium sp.]
MVLIYYSDIIPILFSCVVFSMLAFAHRIFIPGKYSAFLQYKEEENARKTIESTSIRMCYMILGTSCLSEFLRFSEKQIIIGIFLACFLNVWPAIIQNQLLKFKKTKSEWLTLLGYILFILFSMLIGMGAIRLFIPLIKGDITVYWFDNQGITIIVSLILIAFPITIESIMAKSSRIVIVNNINTFLEEIYIVERQMQLDSILLNRNKYTIDKIAREYDINATLLEAILRLEIFYRGRMYYRWLEWLICHCASWYAIKKDISVGIAQIKISTAEEVLRKDAREFIKKLTDDKFNIEVCARLIKKLIDQYGERTESSAYNDVYEFIACKYVGSFAYDKSKTALIYSAVLRSFMKNEKLFYTGTNELGRSLVLMFDKNNIEEYPGIDYNELQKFIEKISNDVHLKKYIYDSSSQLRIEFICSDQSIIEYAETFAKVHNLECSIYPL